MTVQTTAARISYAGNDLTTVFSFPYRFLADSHLKVFLVDASGNPTTQSLTTHYTVSGAGDDAGGSVTMLTAPATGKTLTIIRDPVDDQQTDYASNDAFPAETHERALDLRTMNSQRLRDMIGRCLRLSDGDPVVNADLELVPKASRLGKFLRFNDTTGAPEMAVSIGTTVLSQSVIAAFLNPQTDAEDAGGSVAVNLQYQVGWVPRYGTVAEGADDTAEIQAAFNAARYGLGRVHFPSMNKNGQTVYLCSEIEVYEGTYVTADEGVIIEKNAGSATSHIFDCVSTLGTATALTANTAKRDTTVAVTSAAGLSVGQVVIIRDAQYKWSTNGRNLELNEITDITGLTITLKNRLIGAYLTASTAELVPVTVPARKIKFENVHCRIPTAQDGGGFYCQEAYDCDFINCSSKGQKGQAGLMAWRSAYVRVFGGAYSDGQSQSTPGYGYGIAFSQSSHNCVAVGARMRNVRENAISLGSRFCFFIDCEAHSTYDNAFNTHADGNEDCGFIDCRSYFARSKGFYCGGVTAQAPDKRIRFLNCENHYSGYLGFWADGAAGVESEDIEFNGCKDFHSGDDTATSYGFHLLRSTRPRIVNCTSDADGEANVRALIKAEICTDAEIKSNKLRGATSGWGIIHANCTGIVIDDNEISDIEAASPAVHAESTASTKVYVRRNKADNDINFTKNAGDIHELNEWNTKRQYNKGAAAALADGGTIAHGLIAAPTSVRVTASIAGEFASVTAVDGTNITVAIKKHDGTAGTAQTIYWEAEF